MRVKITNDLGIKLLLNTYLFNIDEIDRILSEMYWRYRNIIEYADLNLKRTNLSKFELIELFEKIETARTFLFFIGVIYCETIASEAIERRLQTFPQKIKIDSLNFMQLIDTPSFKLKLLKYKRLLKKTDSDFLEQFEILTKFYLLIKEWKNKTQTQGKGYFDEEIFNETKNKLLKRIELEIGYKTAPCEWFYIKKEKDKSVD